MKTTNQTLTTKVLVKRLGFRNWTMGAALLAALTVAGVAGAQTTTIYQDNFSRTGNLLGSSPDVVNTGGATYSGADSLGSDGTQVFWTVDNMKQTRTNSLGQTYSYYPNAFLPFTPVAGHVYTLSADIQPLGVNNQWLALGFAGNNAVSNAYFLSDANPYGAPWSLVRGNNSGYQNFRAGANNGNVVGPGNTNVVDQISIVLDTTTPLWSVQWYTNGVAEYASAYTYTANPTISYVGFGADSTIGLLDNFTLTDMSAVPEPSAAAMLGIGGLLLGLCFRWRRTGQRRNLK